MTDKEIIQLYLNRDERGIEETQRAYGKWLMKIAEELLSKEDAEECVSDPYLAMWNHIPPDKPCHFFAYMVRILRNNAKNRLKAMKTRKRSAEIVELSEELAACLPDPKASTEEEAILNASDLINRFLQKQTREKQDLFVLRYWYGKEIKEIADRYKLSESKVRTVLYQMQNDLKRFVRGG